MGVSTIGQGDSYVGTSTSSIVSVSGTTNRITSTGGTSPVIDISAAYIGQSSITTVGTITTGTWSGTVIGANKGGTGVANNAASTITIAGAFGTTLTVSGTTAVTLPTTGTLLSSANNLSDVASTSTARTNLGLGLFSSPSFANTTVSGGFFTAAGGTSPQQSLQSANSTASYTYDPLSNGGFRTDLTLNAATPAIAFAANYPPANTCVECLLYIKQDATGGRLPTFSNITWANNIQPAIYAAANAITPLRVIANSTGWYGYPEGISNKDVTANTSTAYTIDPANGQAFELTMTAASPVITLATAPSTGNAELLFVRLIQDATGGRAPTFSNVTYASGSAPTIAQAIGTVTYLTIQGAGGIWTMFAMAQPTDAITVGALTVNGTSTLNGGQLVKTRVVIAAGAVTVTAADYCVIVNKTSGAATVVNLPAGVTNTAFVIKDGKGDAATNNITITPASGTIDGATTSVINTNYGASWIIYNGTQWNLI